MFKTVVVPTTSISKIIENDVIVLSCCALQLQPGGVPYLRVLIAVSTSESIRAPPQFFRIGRLPTTLPAVIAMVMHMGFNGKTEHRSWQRQSKIFSLSTELLLLILDNVCTPGLLALARTSRLLHHLALPTYLSRYGIHDPTSRTLVLESDAAVQALPGLQISLFITSLDHLSYKFRGVHPHFAREVHQLLCFVTRLSQVNEVTLDLGNIDSRWVDGFAITSSIVWKPDFLRLLDVILKKKCLSLTVTHGRFLNPAPPSPPSFKLTNRHHVVTIIDDSLSAIRQFLGSSRRISSKHGVTLHHASYPSELYKFCIHADILFSPSFHEWTMGTINTCPITSLSFRLAGLHSSTWTSLLSCITIPTLTHFSPETADITFTDLLRFFSRHPSIIDVRLHAHINHLGSGRLSRPFINKKRLLPNLASLGGCLGNINILLDYLQPVPQLQSMSLSLSVHQRPFQTSDFEKLNGEIGTVIQDTRPLALSLRFSVPFLHGESFESKPNDEIFLHSFRSVRALNLSTDGCFDFSRWIIPGLLNWLSKTFPALHDVSFASDCVPVDAEHRDAFVNTISHVYNIARLPSSEKRSSW